MIIINTYQNIPVLPHEQHFKWCTSLWRETLDFLIFPSQLLYMLQWILLIFM